MLEIVNRKEAQCLLLVKYIGNDYLTSSLLWLHSTVMHVLLWTAQRTGYFQCLLHMRIEVFSKALVKNKTLFWINVISSESCNLHLPTIF